MIKLSDFVIEHLAGLGVKQVFLLPGGGCMHLVDSLGKSKKIEHTAVLHEQAAAIAADAYAQFKKSIGAVLVTTGPGGTNALTGVAASWIDSTPVIVISGQAKRQDLLKDRGVRQMGVQEVDVISIVKPITKYAVTIMDPNSIKYHLDKAVLLAKSGRQGPVWLEIPLDVQGSMIDARGLRGLGRKEAQRLGGVEAWQDKRLKTKVEQIIELINKAKRPVILAGHGIRSAGAEKEFVKLIEKLKIPVLLTWRSADMLPDSHPLYFGRPGAVGQRAANFIQQNADLLISIGARLDLPQTAFDHKNFVKNAVKVVVDIDKNEIAKLDFDKKNAVNMDAGEFIEAMLENSKFEILPLQKDWRVTNINGIRSGQSNSKQKRKNEKETSKTRIAKKRWVEWCSNIRKKYPVPDPASLKTNKKYINTYGFVAILSDLMKANDVLIPGSSGSCAEVTMQTVKVKKGLRIINTPGLGSMGFGVPASIGACIASGKKTICIIGDGGLQHNIQELETIKRLKLPLKLFVLNNNGYGSIRMMQNRHFKGRLVACDPTSGLTLPELEKIAKAYGLKYLRLNSTKNIKGIIGKVLNTKGPVVCEVYVDPMQETIPRVSSKLLPDGRIISVSMEDLYPFIARDDFEKNMSMGVEK